MEKKIFENDILSADCAVAARSMDELFSEKLNDICAGNSVGKRALDELIGFCRQIGSSQTAVIDLIDPGFLGAGPNINAIRSACISARYADFEQYSDEKTEELILSALLHDIGADEDLNDEREYAEHVMNGYRMLTKCADDRISRNVRDAVMQHHEHYDGSGYPFGVSGEAVADSALVVGLIDLFLELSRCTGNLSSVREELEKHRAEFPEKIYNDFIELAFNEVL